MKNELDSGGCPQPESPIELVQRYVRIREATYSEDALAPLYITADQIAQTVFGEHLNKPPSKKERPWVVDDSGTLVILPGSLGYPPSVEAEMFTHNMLSTTHNLLHREDNRERVARLLKDISTKIPLFSNNSDQFIIDEIKRNYKAKQSDTTDHKHDSMLSATYLLIATAYRQRVYQGIMDAGETFQSIENFVALRETMIEIDKAISNGQKSLEEAIEDAFFDKKQSNVAEGILFILAGVNEGAKVSVAAIDAMRNAVKEWNETHPDDTVDFYQFAQTEGKKWIAVMAAGHKFTTFELLRGLCGESYQSYLPTFPPRTLGLGTYNGTKKLGFRMSELNEDQLFYLQKMYASYTAGEPRTKCPALGTLAEELYSNILSTYKQCMS